MVRFSAKIEIEPNSLAIRRIRKVPTIASPPIISGSSAATPLRKKPEGEQEEQREDEYLRHPQVVLHLLVHLLRSRGRAADRDAGLPRKLVGDLLRGVLLLLVPGGLQADAEIGRVAVLRDEVGTLGLEVADHPCTSGSRAACCSIAAIRCWPAAWVGEVFSISTITLDVADSPRPRAVVGRSRSRVDGSSAPYGSSLLGDGAASAPATTKKIRGEDHGALAVPLCERCECS